MTMSRHDLTAVDNAGNVLPSATVTVRSQVPGLPLAALYSDRDGTTPLGNPMTADSDGQAGFFCVGGAYQIVVTSGALTRTRNYVPIGRLQEVDQFDITTATTRTDLKAVPSSIKSVVLAESGRFGIFNVVSGDFSAHVALDTNEGVYIEMDDTPATAAVRVRQFDFVNYYSRMFGAVADHSTDNTSIINSIIEVANLTNTLTSIGKQSAANIHIEGGVRFASDSLSFLSSEDWCFVYLHYFINSDTTQGAGPSGFATNERVILSVNSGYPGDPTGALVAERREVGPVHPSITVEVAKHIGGADDHMPASQARIPTSVIPARASYNIMDEGVDRWRAVYEGYGDASNATSVLLQTFTRTVSLANVGSTGWTGIPANDTVFWGVTSGARAYKTGHGSGSIQGVWISGTFVVGEQITDGSTTSENSISGGGVTYTGTAQQGLFFGINHPVVTYGIFPGHSPTAFAIGGRLMLGPSTSLGQNKEAITSPALLWTRDTGAVPTTGKQIVLDSNQRLIGVNGVSPSTTPRGHINGNTAHGRFTHAGLSPLTGSFNFASVTNSGGTGVYEVTFSSALASANYTVTFGTSGKNFPTYDSRTTSGFTIFNFNSAGAALNVLFEIGFTVSGGDI